LNVPDNCAANQDLPLSLDFFYFKHSDKNSAILQMWRVGNIILTSVQGFIRMTWLEMKAVMVPATHRLDTITKNSIPFALLLQDCQQGVKIM